MGKKVASFLTSVLTDGKENISVGSFCIFFFTIVFSYVIIYSVCFDKKLPITGYEMGSILLALYGSKKIPQVWENKNQQSAPPKNIGY
jgi:hypothetical protein